MKTAVIQTRVDIGLKQDADDFFEEDAFLVFDKYQDSNHDIVYFNTRSVFSDSLLPSNRFSIYKSYIEFCDNTDAYKINLLKFVKKRADLQ